MAGGNGVALKCAANDLYERKRQWLKLNIHQAHLLYQSEETGEEKLNLGENDGCRHQYRRLAAENRRLARWRPSV